MKVAIAVHGRFHAFELATQLHKRGMLRQLATTYPKLIARRFLPSGVSLRTAPRLEARRRLRDSLSFGAVTDTQIARAFGAFAAKTLPLDADIFVGWSGASLEAARLAKDRGIKVVIERGSTHIAHQTHVLTEEYAHFKLRHTPTELGVIERELEEYALADAIAVPSTVARESFISNGVPEKRLMVIPYGVDLNLFSEAIRAPQERLRVLFVGAVGVRKGIPWLLRAFASLAHLADLHLIGPVEDGMDEIFATEPMTSVVVRGPVRGDRLPAEYAKADVFCLPSIEEGMGLVVLQAMASGLPVVISDQTGAKDVVSPGVDGLIVPARDVSALSEALESLLEDRERAEAMGQAARQKVASGYSWDDYGTRVVAAYERVLVP